MFDYDFRTAKTKIMKVITHLLYLILVGPIKTMLDVVYGPSNQTTPTTKDPVDGYGGC